MSNKVVLPIATIAGAAHMQDRPTNPEEWAPAFVRDAPDRMGPRHSEVSCWTPKPVNGKLGLLNRLRSRAGITFCLWLVFVLALMSSTLGVWMFAVWAGFHVNPDGKLMTGSGGIVQVASSETIVAADGTWRMRSNQSNLLATGKVEAWSSLVDLPMQPIEFFEHLQRVSIHVDGRVQLYSITGFTWYNASYMELETTRDRDLIIAAGKAFVRDRFSSEIKHVVRPANEPQCGRRLSPAASTQPRAYSWAGLVSQYHSEIESSSTGRDWRRLDETDEGMTDMLEWFGALISSDVAAGEAREQASEAVRASYCKFNTSGLECKAVKASLNAQPPRLSTSGYMRFTVREMSHQLPSSSGELMHFYIDISDWALGRENPQVRQKLASRITLSDINVSEGGAPPWIDITEFIGSDAYRYEMPHPAAWPEVYKSNISETKDRGFALATALLESNDHGDLKLNCQHERFLAHSDGYAAQKQTVADEVDFRCEDGVFTWDIGGWRVETLANGSILAFVAFGDKSGSETLHLAVERFADGGDDEINPTLAKAFEDGTIFGGCDPEEVQALDVRRLGWKDTYRDLQGWLSNTIWCGTDTDNANTECPTSSNSGDLTADRACRRHDHCPRSASVFGIAARMGCSCDHDLKSATNNWAVQAIFGDWGVSSIWGCYNKQHYHRWGSRRRWRWHREKVYGETTRYGPWRYNSGRLHNYGYAAKPKECDGDLF